jgi:riboflavin kinase/FMN adenylyltransferase
MKVYHKFSDYLETAKLESVTTIGMFDGLHIGHQKVIKQCVDLSNNKARQSVVISFSNHPSSFFTNSIEIQANLLTPTDEKISLFNLLGVDVLFLIPFDEYIATISAKQFVDDILINMLNTTYFVLGYDNRFGFNREGSIQFMQKWYPQINSFEISAEMLNGEIISSTKIKQLLELGDIELVNQMLGRNYSITGVVIKGKQLGRTINFPTANISLSSPKQLIPSNGVYLVEVFIEGELFHGLTNIGYRPTVDSDTLNIHIETYIFDFDQEIYSSIIQLNFLKKCRNEKKFLNLEELKNQIAQDVIWAKKQLAQIHITT